MQLIWHEGEHKLYASPRSNTAVLLLKKQTNKTNKQTNTNPNTSSWKLFLSGRVGTLSQQGGLLRLGPPTPGTWWSHTVVTEGWDLAKSAQSKAKFEVTCSFEITLPP